MSDYLDRSKQLLGEDKIKALEDKVILVSDSLPITHSDLKEAVFADSKIFYNGQQAFSANGTLAGSTKLVPDMVKILGKKKGRTRVKYKDYDIRPKVWTQKFASSRPCISTTFSV